MFVAQAVVGGAIALGLGSAAYLQATGIVPQLALVKSAPRYTWTSVDKRHWQASSATSEDRAITDAREVDGAGCANAGMVRVKGRYKLDTSFDEVERLQDAACTDWINKEFPARCRTFDRGQIASSIATLPTRALDFCMDRFEYPNMQGENPMVVVTFHEAEGMCKRAKKRLCSESEWTFACEGDEAQPYPYGYTRDSTACVVDRTWRPFKEGALAPRNGPGAREELDRLWQAEPSGSRGACKSMFGVYDMTGNVDEWTHTVRSTGYKSVLKGGYWGPVRARCRPATRAHNEDFVAYQQGFRCCAEADSTVPAPKSSVPPPPPSVVDIPQGLDHDGGAPPRAMPIAEVALGTDRAADGDELSALKNARVGLACTVTAGAPGAGESLRAGAGALGVGLAFCTRRGRRRGRRSGSP